MMDVDINTPGGHLLPELLGDHGSISKFRGVKILDLHDKSSRSLGNGLF
jgi:hypothetical protein